MVSDPGVAHDVPPQAPADRWFALALAAQAQGKTDEAIAGYRNALRENPDYAPAHNNLGNCLAARGDVAGASACYREALRLNPAYAEAAYNLGLVLQSQGNHLQAITFYEKAISLNPRYADAYNNWGNALHALGRMPDALRQYEAALALAPDNIAARYNYGIALATLGRRPEALAQYKMVIECEPNHAEAHYSLGLTHAALREYNQAVPHYQAAIKLKPNYAEAYNALGSTFEATGRIPDAQKAFEAAIARAPRNLRYYRNLFNSQKVLPGTPHLAVVENLAAKLDTLSPDDRVQLHFALGKAYADMDQHERSFRHLIDGNTLHRRRIAYNEAALLQSFERIRRVFTRDFIRRHERPASQSDVPIFILGMPRSGTSLIEQILASHPEVYGAGELTTFGRCVERLRKKVAAATPFPEFLASLPDAAYAELGMNYRERLGSMAPASFARITDKMPGNFQFVGIIHLALPNAKIIHARRDPVDTCLSCFSKLFTRGQSYSYDLRELGRYYRSYERLMQHWREVIPPETLIDVRYEDVVEDIERESRKILAHCSLEWNDACLSFHKTERPVPTASAVEVRQPIYRSSVNRRRRHEAFLGPLLEALEGREAFA
jgi:tetratricopeptide (TPR) repeat protein